MAKIAYYHYLTKKKNSNLSPFWKYVGIYYFFKTQVCRETRTLKTRVL